jgi:hypothetical protein
MTENSGLPGWAGISFSHIPDIGSGAHSDFHPTNTRSFYPFYNIGDGIATEEYLLTSLECVELNSSVSFMALFVTNT